MRELLERDEVESGGIRNGQRPQQHRIDKPECGGTGANRESERQNCGSRRDSVFQDLPSAEYHIRPQRIQPGAHLDIPTLFAQPKMRAEYSVYVLRTASVFDPFAYMRLQLLIEFTVEAIAR